MNLIPQVKKLELLGGAISKRGVKPYVCEIDARLGKALRKLPLDNQGLSLYFDIGNDASEEYRLELNEDSVRISSKGVNGAFYAIQTLRQLLKSDELFTLVIEDKPDFGYRGFYHDVTRGKVPKVETLKSLVDTLAYYKINSLQLYVEHTYEFKECKKLNEKCGYLTAEELKELDEYCQENFIDFIPSISTFGHMYEILELPESSDLRILPDLPPSTNRWLDRMRHHTINPEKDGSIKLISSLIDQYSENFTSDYFNICCDETFDLKEYAEKNGKNEGELYIGFVGKIIDHVKSKNKHAMMWGDILLHHPDMITKLPSDTVFLNWDYAKDPNEKNIEVFSKLGCKQIVCPGTSTWNKISENVTVSEDNISKLAEYGYKYGAVGLLNTNWGDWGNACSLELALYGLTLGAEKSWSARSAIDDEYYKRVDKLLYESDGGVSIIKRLADMYTDGTYSALFVNYCHLVAGEKIEPLKLDISDIARSQSEYKVISDMITKSAIRDDIKEEMLVAVEGTCLLTELGAKISGINIERVTNTERWIKKFRELWLKKNKPSELDMLTAVFEYIEAL